jgi:molybdate transport system substrate-binding protein
MLTRLVLILIGIFVPLTQMQAGIQVVGWAKSGIAAERPASFLPAILPTRPERGIEPRGHCAQVAGLAWAARPSGRNAHPTHPARTAAANAAAPVITVFAAASMKNALDAVHGAFTERTGIMVSTSYAASSALIKQIENGAPADVFLSADLAWMDYGAQRNLINNDTRVDLLGNRLVLIAPRESRTGAVTIGPGLDLAAIAGDGRIVTGDVRAVPVGRYAKAALEKLGAWEKAQPKFAMTENVRAALTLVARGEAALGIVYETDAKVEPNVKIVGTFPADSHPPIVYPVALTPAAGHGAVQYLAYLRSPAAKAIFEAYGFTFLPGLHRD